METNCKTLVIVAAGNSTRMGQLPKAASLINGVPNLYNLVRGCKNYFSKIYVASNAQNAELYRDILIDFSDTAEVIVIVSGNGCGDAINTILNDEAIHFSEETIFCWGDTFFTQFEIFEELQQKTMSGSPLLIPCRMEANPYAWFDLDFLYDPASFGLKKIEKANFKKRGDISEQGVEAHDQSLFKLNVKEMIKHLNVIKNVLWNGKKYINGEMTFLDTCNYLYNCENPALSYITQYDSFSYNTPEELEEINKKVQNK